MSEPLDTVWQRHQTASTLKARRRMSQQGVARHVSVLFRVFVLPTLLIATLGVQALAADFEAGLEAYTRGDYARALREFRPLADQGDARAQSRLGSMYHLGMGVPRDFAEALKWYRRSAEQGYAGAQRAMIVMYNYVDLPEKDIEEAVKWYRKGAEDGHSTAQFNLARAYDFGEGVPEDDAEAVKWYRKAAEQGNASAQRNLGVMYYLGEGVAEDDVQAHAWINIAAAQGDEGAEEAKKLVAESMTREDISQAQQLAREYWEKYVLPFRN